LKEKVLITGGAGFIGSHLCDFFINQGYAVLCIDNLTTTSTNNIKHLFENKYFRFIKWDITKPIKFRKRIDYILHFATPASPLFFNKYPVDTAKTSSLGTLNTLQIAKSSRAKFMLASSDAVYGDLSENPQKEQYIGNVNPIGGRSAYDESKRFAETLTMAYHRQHKVDTSIVRIFHTYGERLLDDGRLIPHFIAQALRGRPIVIFGNGMQTRSFCYISDLIMGIYKVLTSNVHDPVNLGNPKEISILDLAHLIIKIAESKSKIVFKKAMPEDRKIRKPDITLARSKLKWEPKVGLEEGLIRTVNYMRLNGF
jgi:dTDP-glucose 4,6-dehydratase